MMEGSDNTLLKGLREESSISFERLYDDCFPATAKYVAANSGSAEDAQDLFQEAVIVLLHKIRDPQFVLTSSVKTYLLAVVRNLHLKKLRDGKRLPMQDYEPHQYAAESICEEPMLHHKDEEVKSWLEKISITCRQILKAIFFLNEPMRLLMEKMGWKNNHTAANQKYKCIQQIKKQSAASGNYRR